jgi:hypothetical protein
VSTLINNAYARVIVRGARTMLVGPDGIPQRPLLKYFKYGMELSSVEPIGSIQPIPFLSKMRTLEAKCLALLSLLASGASAANFLNTCKEIERAISPASEVFYPGSCFHGFYFTGLGLTQTPVRITSVQRRYRSRLCDKHSEFHLQRRTWDSTRRS